MEFDRPDLHRSEKKRRKKSAEPGSRRPKEAQSKSSEESSAAEKQAGMLNPEIIANLLRNNKTSEEAAILPKKKKKKKHLGVEVADELDGPEPDESLSDDDEEEKPTPAHKAQGSEKSQTGLAAEKKSEKSKSETEKRRKKREAEIEPGKDKARDADEAETESRVIYEADQIVVVPLHEKDLEGEVLLRLPEVDVVNAEAADEVESEPLDLLSLEGLADDSESLAVEQAGLSLGDYSLVESPLAAEIKAPEAKPVQAEVVAEAPRQEEVPRSEAPAYDIPSISEDVLASAYMLSEADQHGRDVVSMPAEVPSTEFVPRPEVSKAEHRNLLDRLSDVEYYQQRLRRRVWKLKRKDLKQNRRLNHNEADIEQINSWQQNMEKQQAKATQHIEAIDKKERLTIAKAAQFSLDNLPKEAQLIRERLELDIPDDHRIERSAWLSFEVDKKTGRVVEDTVIEYGEEYRRERQQEALEAEPQEVAVASGQLAVGGAGTVNASQALPASTVSAQNSLKDKSRELYNKLESTIPLRDHKANSAADLALWVALFAVVTAIILVA